MATLWQRMFFFSLSILFNRRSGRYTHLQTISFSLLSVMTQCLLVWPAGGAEQVPPNARRFGRLTNFLGSQLTAEKRCNLALFIGSNPVPKAPPPMIGTKHSSAAERFDKASKQQSVGRLAILRQGRTSAGVNSWKQPAPQRFALRSTIELHASDGATAVPEEDSVSLASIRSSKDEAARRQDRDFPSKSPAGKSSGDGDDAVPSYEDFDPMSPCGPLEVNNKGDVWLPQASRPRRNRKKWAIRRMLQETSVRLAELVYPLFVHDKEEDVPIEAMPGCKVFSIRGLLEEVREAMAVGIHAFMLFPKVDPSIKHKLGHESYNPDGVIPRALTAIKAAYPEAVVCTDVALDPYTDSGHDGVVADDGDVENDFTVGTLCKQAVLHSGFGADIVCPSDMMDGRVGAIRDALDAEGFTSTSIMAYSSKYCSALYGPFRDALGTTSHSGNLQLDGSQESLNAGSREPDPPYLSKKTYQVDISNSREALIEQALDEEEGADIILVKPAYLDIVSKVQSATDLPVAVYHVSGEYSMIKAAAAKGWISEKDVVLEAMKGMKRAGAKLIITYFAKQIAEYVVEDVAGRWKEGGVGGKTEIREGGGQWLSDPRKRMMDSWRDGVNFVDLSF